MSFINNINTISRNEGKLLWRSWFFRVYAILLLLFLVFFSTMYFAIPSQARWSHKALESMFAYVPMFFLSITQSLVAVFLASDFLKRDKKLDTTEVIYVRPMSNLEYVFGKTLGILKVFVLFDLVVLLVGVVFNVIVPDVQLDIKLYFYYLLILVIPGLVYSLGLSFVLMSVLKNQAVTFLVILAIFGFSLFYFSGDYYNAFDFSGILQPALYSSITGFGNGWDLLLQRGAYFVLGIGFIMFTIYFMVRLPNKAWLKRMNLFIAILVTSIGGVLMAGFYSLESGKDKRRLEYLASNDRHTNSPVFSIEKNEMNLIHKGSKIDVESTIIGSNQNEGTIDTLWLALNPGFKIREVKHGSVDLKYKTDKHLIGLLPLGGVKPGESFSFTIKYSGHPVDEICYLNTWDKPFYTSKNNDMAKLAQRYSFVNADYVLLTPESLWYPIAGTTYNTINHLHRVPAFTLFNLSVRTDTSLMVISQGKQVKKELAINFLNKQPLDGLSLIIGKYEKKIRTIDKVDYAIYNIKGHDFYSRYFPNLGDSIVDAIKGFKSDYERNIDLTYPFKRFSMIEVPAQFSAQQQLLTVASEMVQPEMVLIPEKAYNISGADFARYIKYEKDRNDNKNKLPKDLEYERFRRFLFSTFYSGMQRNSAGIRVEGMDQAGFLSGASTYTGNQQNIFPLFYTRVTAFYSHNVPFMNNIIETYLRDDYQFSFLSRTGGGVDNKELANLALKDSSLASILSNPEQRKIVADAIGQKGNYLFALLQQKVTKAAFDDFFYYFLEDNQFKVISEKKFSEAMNAELKFNPDSLINSWSERTGVASYIFNTPKVIETRDDEGQVFVVKFSAWNKSSNTGLLSVSLRAGRGGPGSGSGEEQRFYTLKPGETHDYSIVMYDQPRMMTINTVMSTNIPMIRSFFLRNTEKYKRYPIEESDKLSVTTLRRENDNEIIVDNEDKGFKRNSSKTINKLRKFADSQKEENKIKYGSISSYYNPDFWRAVSHTSFYGTDICSGYYTKGGDGKLEATWQAKLKEPGYYNIYTYIPLGVMYSFDRGRSSGGSRGSSGDRGSDRGGPKLEDDGTEYNYTIYTADGKEQLTYTINRDTKDGWNLLGSYYLSGDSCKVVLSNKSNGKRIFADAIKWERKEQ